MDNYPKSTVLFLVEKAFLAGILEPRTYENVIKMNKQCRMKYIKYKMVQLIKNSRK